MDTQTLVLIVAICAMWLSLVSGCVATYLILSRRWGALGLGGVRPRFKPAKGVLPTSQEPVPVLIDEGRTSWGVMILFDSPSFALNERLRLALASAGAVYESSSGAFTLQGESARNPIYIENAFPPGELPSFTDENAQYLIQGIRLKVMADSMALAPSKLQLARLVTVAKSMARIGGTIVDAHQQPITQAGFQAVIDGKATM